MEAVALPEAPLIGNGLRPGRNARGRVNHKRKTSRAIGQECVAPPPLDGKPDKERLTEPLNPLVGVTVTGVVPPVPVRG